MLIAATIEFRLEWSKAYARKARWNEEVILLKEEMRRTLEFLDWRSKDWHRKGDHQVISSLAICPFQLEGLSAYACRQADIFRKMHEHFLGIWRGLEQPREHLNEPLSRADLSFDAIMEVDGDNV